MPAAAVASPIQVLFDGAGFRTTIIGSHATARHMKAYTARPDAVHLGEDEPATRVSSVARDFARASVDMDAVRKLNSKAVSPAGRASTAMPRRQLKPPAIPTPTGGRVKVSLKGGVPLDARMASKGVSREIHELAVELRAQQQAESYVEAPSAGVSSDVTDERADRPQLAVVPARYVDRIGDLNASGTPQAVSTASRDAVASTFDPILIDAAAHAPVFGTSSENTQAHREARSMYDPSARPQLKKGVEYEQVFVVGAAAAPDGSEPVLPDHVESAYAATTRATLELGSDPALHASIPAGRVSASRKDAVRKAMAEFAMEGEPMDAGAAVGDDAAEASGPSSSVPTVASTPTKLAGSPARAGARVRPMSAMPSRPRTGMAMASLLAGDDSTAPLSARPSRARPTDVHSGMASRIKLGDSELSPVKEGFRSSHHLAFAERSPAAMDRPARPLVKTVARHAGGGSGLAARAALSHDFLSGSGASHDGRISPSADLDRPQRRMLRTVDNANTRGSAIFAAVTEEAAPASASRGIRTTFAHAPGGRNGGSRRGSIAQVLNMDATMAAAAASAAAASGSSTKAASLADLVGGVAAPVVSATGGRVGRVQRGTGESNPDRARTSAPASPGERAGRYVGRDVGVADVFGTGANASRAASPAFRPSRRGSTFDAARTTIKLG